MDVLGRYWANFKAKKRGDNLPHFRHLVEAGGFEPPSVSPLPLDLHV